MPLENRRAPADRPVTAIDASDTFSQSIHVDVGALSHTGKVRSRNEDHFLVARIGRYLETAMTSLPPGEVPERAEE